MSDPQSIIFPVDSFEPRNESYGYSLCRGPINGLVRRAREWTSRGEAVSLSIWSAMTCHRFPFPYGLRGENRSFYGRGWRKKAATGHPLGPPHSKLAEKTTAPKRDGYDEP